MSFKHPWIKQTVYAKVVPLLFDCDVGTKLAQWRQHHVPKRSASAACFGSCFSNSYVFQEI